MSMARLRSKPKVCCTAGTRSQSQSRDKVSFIPQMCAQCQTEQTDDESEATEEGISQHGEVADWPANTHMETLETTTQRATRVSEYHGDNSVCIEIPAGPSPASMPPRQSSQPPELLRTDEHIAQTCQKVELHLPPLPSLPPSLHIVSPSSNHKPLKSSLRARTSKAGKKAKASQTRRRVRGLWNENCSSSPFSELHDDMILFIMSHLSLDDLCVSSMVCQRWKHITSRESAWKNIDATEFIRKSHSYHVRASPDSSAKANSSALAARLQKHAPEKLTIRSIEHYLTSDIYLPSMQGLKELTLTGFADFTDTHVHVMLLSLADVNLNFNYDVKARAKKENVLCKLAIEQCPLLTNSSIPSIALHCPNLEELSLRGNLQMDDISSLKLMWKLEPQPTTAKMSRVQPTSCMASLFAPPPPPPPPKSPERPSKPPGNAGLASLFALPGNSPPRRVVSLGLAHNNTVKPRKLTRVDFSNTRITAQAFVNSANTAPGDHNHNMMVELESIIMRGSGESWSDVQLKALSKNFSVSKLTTFDIGCANAFSGSTAVTDAGLEALFSAVTLPLQRLELAGHRSIQGAGVANILSAAIDLVELDLESCKGIGSFSNKASTIALGRALLKHGGGGKGGLRRLSLALCFSNEKGSSKLTMEEFSKETMRGSLLLKALCKSPSSRTLEHLDLSGCWFVTASDEAMVRLYCTRLVTLRLAGTRCTRKD
jgi:hypothetical protein